MKLNALFTRTFTLMLVAGVSVLVGAVIFIGGVSSTPASRAFLLSPEFVVWFFVNDALVACYPILIAWMWQPLRQLGKYYSNHKLEILLSVLLTLALYIFPQVIGLNLIQLKPLPLDYLEARMLILMLIGFFGGALLPILGIWFVQIAIREIFGEFKPSKEGFKEYLDFRDYLQQFLLVLGGLEGVFMLTAGAFRKAAIAQGATTPSLYPSIALLVLGAYYTLLIAIIYFPVYAALVKVGRQFLDSYFALPAPDQESWTDILAKRKQLESFMGLDVSPVQRFVTGLTILAPFASSIFSFLLDK